MNNDDRIVISSGCTCDSWKVWCIECGYETWVYEEPLSELPCPDCGEALEDQPSYETCEGECYEDAKSLIESKLSKIPFESGYAYIGGQNMGWRQRSGFKIEEADEVSPSSLSVNGDWTQYWSFESDKALVQQGTHDAPTGEFYEIRNATLAEICFNPNADVYHDGVCDRDNDYCEPKEAVSSDDVIFECGAHVTDIEDVDIRL